MILADGYVMCVKPDGTLLTRMDVARDAAKFSLIPNVVNDVVVVGK